METVKIIQVAKDYPLGKTVVQALRGIDLTINNGEFVTIAGPSGSGKSTLLNLIGCLDSPTKGEVWLNNTKINGQSDRALNKIRLHTIGFIFQSFNLIPVLNVAEAA